MLEKFKKNKNDWYLHSLGFTLLAIICVLKYEQVEISMIFFGISIILMGIGSLYNQNKEQKELLEKICSNQKIILSELLYKSNNDRKYEYKKDGQTVMLNKGELLHIFMNEEKANIG